MLPLARHSPNLTFNSLPPPPPVPVHTGTASVLVVVIIFHLAPLANLDPDNRPAVPMMLQIQRLLLGAVNRGTAARGEPLECVLLLGRGIRSRGRG